MQISPVKDQISPRLRLIENTCILLILQILKLDQYDESGEIGFELRYLKSLTKNERFLLMQKKSKEMKELMRNCGHGRPPEIKRAEKTLLIHRFHDSIWDIQLPLQHRYCKTDQYIRDVQSEVL